MSWSNEETFKFIDLYQSEPAIWDPNNELHKDKNKVNDAWNRIADSLQIPVSELKKKKETLMSAFRMHFKKKQDSIRSGVGEEEMYKPIWVFYDAMEAFLKVKYTCKSIISADEQRTVIGEQTKNMNIKIPAQRRRSVKPPELEKADKEMAKAFNTLNQAILNKDQQNKIEDDCDLYGRLLANKLRKYSDNERQEIMYDIDGLLLKRRPNCTPQYVSSPSQIIISKRPSSSATNYSCPPSPSSNHSISEELYSQTQSQPQNILVDAYARTLNNDC